jgi:hypothetical protein
MILQFFWLAKGVLNKDPTICLDGARPSNTCIPPLFPQNMPTQLHGEPTQKYVCKHKKLRVKIANSYIRMMYNLVNNGALQNSFYGYSGFLPTYLKSSKKYSDLCITIYKSDIFAKNFNWLKFHTTSYDGLPFLGVGYCDADLNFISQLNVLKAPPYPKNVLKIILRSFMNPVQAFL